MLSLNIYNKTKEDIDVRWLNLIFGKIRKQIELEDKIEEEFGLSNSVRLNLIFVDDTEMRKINNRYRGIDKTTDVLSFNLVRDKKFILPNNKKTLGEIIISYPEVERWAGNLNITIKKEIAILFIHGILHILGFDHEKSIEKIKMEKMENEILKKINV